MREDDFIELDFGEDEPESNGTSGSDRENKARENGRFFVSYPFKKPRENVPEEEASDAYIEDTDMETKSDEDMTEESVQPKEDVTEESVQPEVDMTEESIQPEEAVVEKGIQSEKDTAEENIRSDGDAAEKSIQSEKDTAEENIRSDGDAVEESIQSEKDTAEENIRSDGDVVEESIQSEKDMAEESIQSDGDVAEENILSDEEGETDLETAFQTVDSVSEEQAAECVTEETAYEQEFQDSDMEMGSFLETEVEDTQEPADEVGTEEEISEENITEVPVFSEEELTEEESFPDEITELSDPEQIEDFFDVVREVPMPGAEDLPEHGSGSIYGAVNEFSTEEELSAIPKDMEKMVWYLTLPFITGVLLIPVVGIIAAGILLYFRYKKYGHESQVKDLTTVYILLVVCLMVGFLAVYCLTQAFQSTGSHVKETVSGQAEREAAESLAREEAEEREREEQEAWLRTSAQADIGLEEIEISGSGSAQESGEEPDGTLEAEASGENTESAEETGSFLDSFLDNLTGNTEEKDQEYLDNVAADMQELSISGDSCAQYSLARLASQVTLFTAAYDDCFFGERQALISFMSSYHGMQLDNQSFHLKSSFLDMFNGVVRWEATLDNTMYRYMGTVANGAPQGMGVVLVASSVNSNTYIPLYAGTFVNGTMEGYGMEFKENSGFLGIVYEGYFSGGKYAGRGTAYEMPSSVNYQNRLSVQDMAGNQYTSEEISYILNQYYTRYTNAMNAYQSEGALYAYLDAPVVTPVITERGRYEKGKLNGYCICYGSFGIREYAGILKNGVRSGVGISYYEDGSMAYNGEWRNNNYHGTGTLYNADGSVWYEGEFANGDIKPVTQ